MSQQQVMVTLSADVSEFQQAMKDVQKSMDNTAQEVQSAMGQAENATKSGTGSMTTALTAVAGAFTALGGTAMMASSQVSEGVRGLQTKLGATGAELEEYKGVMENVARTGVGSFGEVSDAIVSVSQNMKGLSPKEMEDVTEQSIQLAKVMGSDVSEVTKTSGILMKQFGLSGEEALDMIAKGYQEGLDFAGDYQDSLSEYSVYFKQMGFSGKEMFNYLIEGAQAGAFNIDKVGDALKEFGIRSKDGSKASTEAFEALGFNAKELTKTFAEGGEGAREAYTKVVTELSKVEDEVERNAIGVALFGTQYEDMEKDVIASTANLTDHMGEVGGTAEQMAEDNKSLSQIMQGAWNDLALAIAPVGEVIGEIVEKSMPYISKAVEELGEAIAEVDIDGLIDGFKDMGGVKLAKTLFEGLKTVFTWFKDNIGTITALLAGLAGAFVAFKIITGINTAIGIMTTLFNALRTGTLLATLAQWGFNTALLANPVTWVALAIGALIAIVLLLWMNWDKVSAWLQESWAKIKEVASSCFSAISDAISSAWSAIKDAAVSIWNSIVSFLTGLWNGIIKTGEDIWNGLVGFFEDTFDFIAGIFSEGWQLVSDTTSEIWGEITGWVSDAIDEICGFFDGLWDKACEIAGNIYDAFAGIFDGIKVPSFSVKGSLNPAKWLDEGLPKLSVSWHANGGIVKGTHGGTIVGVGENGGDEAILPLSNKSKMKPFAHAVAKMIPQDEGKERGGVTNNFNIASIVIREEADIKRVAEELHKKQKQGLRAGGVQFGY